jgi:SAM-dependent methyltransferase
VEKFKAVGEIPDQRPIWDKKHSNEDHKTLVGVPSPLAELCLPYLPEHSLILELGSGVGRDAVYFADHGHKVIATDGSEAAITQNKQQRPHPNVEFSELDMREQFPFNDGKFDVVYSNLALHYFSDEKTREIILNVGKVLKFGGLFIFACKSYDSLHNAGREVEPGVVVSPTGATLHFFTKDYTEELLGESYKAEYLDEIDEDFNGRQSKIIRCIARSM